MMSNVYTLNGVKFWLLYTFANGQLVKVSDGHNAPIIVGTRELTPVK